ncbi:hypothetical protein CEP52_002788 [Fusarium oligoseptatum]|uniref:Uncharacterized protein n=1 Tax=Fusarium oligoseptatum TaxID=2604345 RepID=A0A428UC87_9HYPO|nr:hypothetical protein CEP52_002788 [Fusarium oligoseptatum]
MDHTTSPTLPTSLKEGALSQITLITIITVAFAVPSPSLTHTIPYHLPSLSVDPEIGLQLPEIKPPPVVLELAIGPLAVARARRNTSWQGAHTTSKESLAKTPSVPATPESDFYLPDKTAAIHSTLRVRPVAQGVHVDLHCICIMHLAADVQDPIPPFSLNMTS